MVRKITVTGDVLDDRYEITLGELCRICTVEERLIVSMVEEGILSPRGRSPVEWRFSSVSLTRAKRAVRIARDFEIELGAVALVLDLLDEIESLRRERRS